MYGIKVLWYVVPGLCGGWMTMSGRMSLSWPSLTWRMKSKIGPYILGQIWNMYASGTEYEWMRSEQLNAAWRFSGDPAAQTHKFAKIDLAPQEMIPRTTRQTDRQKFF